MPRAFSSADMVRQGRPGRCAFIESVSALFPYGVLTAYEDGKWVVATLVIPQRAICICNDRAEAEMICTALNLAANAVLDLREAA